MLEELQKIFKALIRKRYVQFRFMVLDGSEKNKQIKIENTKQYHFINSGGSIVKINNTITLYPFYTGIMPFEWKGEVHESEFDETVYEYDFISLVGGEPVLGYIYTATTASNALVKYDNTFAFGNLNKLTVILKQHSTKQN